MVWKYLLMFERSDVYACVLLKYTKKGVEFYAML